MARRKSERACTAHERAWVMAFIETGSMSEAFRRAYPKSKLTGDALNASAKKIARRTPVRLLLEDLRSKQAKKHEITVDNWLAEYRKLGYANFGDYVDKQPDGTAVANLNKVTHDQMAAIQEMTVETVLSSDPRALAEAGEEEGGGKKVAVLKCKMKLHDKKSSLDAIGKHFGWFEKDNEQAGNAAGRAAGEAIAAGAQGQGLLLANAVLDLIQDAAAEGAGATAAARLKEALGKAAGGLQQAAGQAGDAEPAASPEDAADAAAQADPDDPFPDRDPFADDVADDEDGYETPQ